MNRMEEEGITLFCIGCKPDVSTLKEILSDILCKKPSDDDDDEHDQIDFMSLCDPVSLAHAHALIDQSNEHFDEQDIVEYIVTTVHEMPQLNQEIGPRLINQKSECRIKPRCRLDGLL